MNTIVSATKKARPELMRDSQKRNITLALIRRPMTFDELAKRLKIATSQQPVLKKKVRVMRRAGLVRTRAA